MRVLCYPIGSTGDRVSFQLRSLLREGRARAPAPLREVEPVEDWLAQGHAALNVIDLRATLKELADPEAVVAKLASFASGGSEHKELCGIAGACVVLWTRQPVWIDGRGLCGYSAGWADVLSYDKRSHIVECGCVRPDKLRTALEHGETLTLVPFRDDEHVFAYRFTPSEWLSGLAERDLFTRAANRGLMK